jgi:hypothetical protein
MARRKTVTATTICTNKRFNGNEPRIRHFGKVKSGELYSVSLRATLGPTVRKKSLERAKTSREKFGASKDFERKVGAREDFE